jgi:DNA-binding transcriptional MerR regulator
MRAELGVRYREGQFSPSEAATISGLSLGLQRDWRSQRLLKERDGGQARFSPRELAEMRVMVKLRSLGVPLQACRSAADEAGAAVVFAALHNHLCDALRVEGPEEAAAELMNELEGSRGHQAMLALADLPSLDQAYRHALVENGRCFLVKALDDTTADERVEVAGLVNLWAVAEAIVKAAPRPLFTLLLPKSG